MDLLKLTIALCPKTQPTHFNDTNKEGSGRIPTRQNTLQHVALH